jgi:pimeloyl-ACP methyl ester carboxylesterase
MHDEALETLPAILARFGISAPVLVGHSDGASIALIHAGSGSSRARALVLEAPHVFVEDVGRAGCARASEAYERAGLKGRLTRYHGPNTDAMFRGWHDVWCSPVFEAWSIEEYLPRITCPVLVIQGEQDEYGTAEHLERIRKGVPGRVKTLMLTDCGHAPHRDQRELFLAEAADFIGSLGPVG